MKSEVVNVGCGIITLAMLGCITPSEKREMKKDLFNAQTRIMQLERQLSDSGKNLRSSGDAANKRIASSFTEIEKVTREMRRIRGEIDALRIGVVTGQLPGTTMSEGSVAATLADLGDRIESLEATQKEILAAIKKVGLGKKKSRKSSKSIAALEKAFGKKQYKYVVEDATKVLAKAKGKEKGRVQYLYAESLYKLGRLRDAALKFNDVIDKKALKEFHPHAKMRMGDCFRHLGDTATAKVYYEELIDEFPGSDPAEKAKERLENLGATVENKQGAVVDSVASHLAKIG